MSCRTAGGNNNPERLWQFLLEKKNGSGEVPSMRWEPWLRRDPRNAKVLEKTNHKGYFINDLENFDAAFFGISPKEAELMDPHQRLALELAWEALEDSGIDPKGLAGSDTAVFMGVDSDDYSRWVTRLYFISTKPALWLRLTEIYTTLICFTNLCLFI